MIIRSIASIHRDGDRYYWKNIEILRDPASGDIPADLVASITNEIAPEELVLEIDEP